MKKLLAFAVVMAFVFTGAALAADVTGWVTDAACSAKGRAGEAHKACAQKCAAKGGDLVIVTDDKKIYKVHNRDAVAELAGEKVTATGKIDGESIHVDSAKKAE